MPMSWSVPDFWETKRFLSQTLQTFLVTSKWIDFGSWSFDFGSWSFDFGSWSFDFGSWSFDFGFCILEFWGLDFGVGFVSMIPPTTKEIRFLDLLVCTLVGRPWC